MLAHFNHESNLVYTNYDDVRSKYLNDERKIGTLVRVLNRQERTIAELKTYMHDCLSQIFHKVEELDQETIEQILQGLPAAVRYSESEQDSPFGLYCSYLDIKREIDLKEGQDRSEELQAAIARGDRLAEEQHQLRMEFAISGQLQAMFIEKEDGYKRQIVNLQDTLSLERINNKIRVDVLNE